MSLNCKSNALEEYESKTKDRDIKTVIGKVEDAEKEDDAENPYGSTERNDSDENSNVESDYTNASTGCVLVFERVSKRPGTWRRA